MSGHLIDVAMQASADNSRWQLRAYERPQCDNREPAEPLTLKEFLDGACRPCVGAGGPKSIMVLFDSHISMVECGRASTIGDAVARGLLDDLPEPLRFRDALPAAAKVEIIVSKLGDGLVDVVKIVHFDKAISAPTAAALCRGQGFAPVFRPGSWAVKKAVQWLLNRLPGYHVRWSSLEPKPETVRKSQSQTWSTDDDNLAEGIRFINKNAPECDAQNEQTYWVLTCIKPDSGTPVAGWPEVKVRAMAQNKSRGVSGAQSMTELPLTTFSLHPVMHQHILPYLYPLLMTSAIVLLGSPGVGKTPALIVMAMAMGRFHIRRLGLSGVKPGWRRAKSLDNFRHRVSQVQEALFLDDPSRSKIDIADLKSFVTVDEEGTCQGRYNDSRLARNQMRAVASNDIVQAEPRIDPASTTTISPDAFFDLIEPIRWEQWLGLVERGRPNSLILEPLNPPRTYKRAPGPGAVRRVEWKHLAMKHLRNRRVVFHTDSAKSYKLRVDGVLHDRVVHAKKRVLVKGKFIWKAPDYVKVVEHRVPGRRKPLRVKAGTQIIDRAWRFMKDRISLNQHTRAGTMLLRNKIRSAQYEYWKRGTDLWLETGNLCTWVMQNFVQPM